MKAKISPRDLEQLSAYLDQQLDPGRRTRLEARLRAEPQLRATFDDLRRTRTLLRRLPRMRAPRNFTLTPQMVGKPIARESSPRRAYPIFQFASALASLLLVVVILGDFLGLGVAPAAAPLVSSQKDLNSAAQEAPPASQPESLRANIATPTQPTGGVVTMPGSNATPGGLDSEVMTNAVPAPGVTPTITTTTPLTLTVPLAQANAPIPTDTIGAASGPPTGEQRPIGQPGSRSLWRVVEISLALVALASGLAALYLRRHS